MMLDEDQVPQERIDAHDSHTRKTLEAIETVIDEIDLQYDYKDDIRLDEIQRFKRQD